VADRFYGVAAEGRLPKDVTEAASTTSAVVEVRVNDAAYGNKMSVLLALEAIILYIRHKETTPIA
jgi:hypothetical protein